MDKRDDIKETLTALLAFANKLEKMAKAKEAAAAQESCNPSIYVAAMMSTYFDRGYAMGLRNSANQILGIISGKEPGKHDETVLN